MQSQDCFVGGLQVRSDSWVTDEIGNEKGQTLPQRLGYRLPIFMTLGQFNKDGSFFSLKVTAWSIIS